MRNFKFGIGFVLFLFLFIPTSLANATSSDKIQLNKHEEVTVEALNVDKKPALGTKISIRLMSTEEPIEVFNGEVNNEGKILFNPNVSINSAQKLVESAGPIQDYVFEITYFSPEGEIKYEYLTVSEFKSGEESSLDEVKKLKQDQKKNIKTIFTGNAENKIDISKKDTVSIAAMPSGCTDIGDGVYRCPITTRDYTEPTKIGSVNIAAGETVGFTLNSGARTSITTGISSGTGTSWTLGGSVTLNADVSTGVDYSIPGTCIGYASTWVCHATHAIFVNYNYRYEHFQYWHGGTKLTDNYKITPISLAGSSSKSAVTYNSNNSKLASSVRNNSHGSWFEVALGRSSEKSYSNETIFNSAFSVKHPVGSFSGNVTTAYKSSHKIKWSTTGSKVFVHYDLDRSGKMFYVTE